MIKCRYIMIGVNQTLVSVYITKLRINTVMTFMKNLGFMFDIMNKHFVRIC